jgi:hypothetical protein
VIGALTRMWIVVGFSVVIGVTISHFLPWYIYMPICWTVGVYLGARFLIPRDWSDDE